MTPPPHLRVTQAQRDMVVTKLQTAYTEGRLDKEEFDRRLGQAMTAKTGHDLSPLLADLRREPSMAPARPAPPPRIRPEPADSAAAGAAHLLGVCSLFIGPLVMLAASQSPYIRKHAAESLNFQLTTILATVGLAITGIGAILIPFVWIAWFVLCIVGGVKTLAGDDFRYPLNLRMIRT